jgi:uncharacterized protein (TIGR02118 family)
MIKTLALIRRRPGLSREAFARHYEEVHVPLAIECLPTLMGYVRNHLLAAPDESPDPEPPGFDCLTEFRYPSGEGLREAIARLQSEAGREIREDEFAFMDKARNTSFTIEERDSGPRAQCEPGGGGEVKAVALIEGEPGLSREGFIRSREEREVPRLMANATGLRRYLRNYVEEYLKLPSGAGPLELACIDELWFEDARAYRASLALWREGAREIVLHRVRECRTPRP